MGETSGSAIRALSLGKPLVVSDVGWFAELPDDAVVQGAGGRARGGHAARRAGGARRPGRPRRRWAPRARELVEREHRLDRVAEAYAAALEELAGGAAVEEHVLREVAHAPRPRSGSTATTRPSSRRGCARSGLASTSPTASRRAARASSTSSGRSRCGPGWRSSSSSPPGSATRSRGGSSRRGSWSTSSSTPSSRRASPTPAASCSAASTPPPTGSSTRRCSARPGRSSSRVPAGLRGGEGDQLGRRLAGGDPGVPARAPRALARRTRSRPPCWRCRCRRCSSPAMLMTENAFYPAFLLAALAIVRLARAARPDADAAACSALVVLAYLTRAQAVAILPALATAPFLVCARRLAALREFRWFFAAGAAAVLLVVVVQVARGALRLRRASAPTRSRATPGTRSGGVFALVALYHWEELILSLGVVPFAALVVLALTIARPARAERAFLAAAVDALVLARARGRGVRLGAVAAGRGAEHVLRRPALPDRADALDRARRARGRGGRGRRGGARRGRARRRAAVHEADRRCRRSPTRRRSLAALVARAVVRRDRATCAGSCSSPRSAPAVLFLFVPRALRARPAAARASSTSGSRRSRSRGSTGQASILDLFQGITAAHPDWVDRAVGRDAHVALIWSGNTDKYSVWENEFFNRERAALLLHALAARRATSPRSRSTPTRRPG